MIDKSRIAPELREIAATIPALEFFEGMDISAMRAAMPVRDMRRPELLRVWEEYAGDGGDRIRIKFYEPAGRKPATPLPAICWFHGGGMALGSPENDDWLCEMFALRAECVVASVDYRKTPEYAYPVPADDAYAGLSHVAGNARRLGIRPDMIAAGGASAGGNLCASVCLRARDTGGPRVCFQMPLFAMLDNRCDTASAQEFTKDVLPFAWNTDANRVAWRWYLREVNDADPSSYASPGREENLANLPPAYICVGELDPLRDENIAYAARLAACGTSVEFHLHAGAFHGFESSGLLTPTGSRAVCEYVGALRRAFITPAIG
jgi:acetyl esterase/lipase